MDEMIIGASQPARGYLTAAGVFVLVTLLLRAVPFSFSHEEKFEIYALPLGVGVAMGVLVGPHWQRPIRASVLLGVALVVAYTIPYTIDTIRMVSEENITMAVREDPAHFAGDSSSEIRRFAVNGRILAFLIFSPLHIGVTALGAMIGRAFGKSRVMG